MNESTVFAARPTGSPVSRPDMGARKLTEDIFPSAEEAVLGEQLRATSNFPSDTQKAPPAVSTGNGKRSLMSSLKAHVAEHPGRSALMAAAAGALAMVVLRSQLGHGIGLRHRRSNK
jgi:hypothetical protein